jgi:DNA-binding NtrC family response regulator
VEVDIRLVAATNRDLRAMVDAGEFREDLFFRLDVVNITLPPLKDRIEDLPLLCGHFIKEFAEKNGKQVDGITHALNMLMAYSWPGNVRELRNTIEKMVVLSRGSRLTARDVPGNIRNEVRGDYGGSGQSGAVAAVAPGSSLAEVEKAMIYAALKKHGGSRTKAADELGISRRTLHRKLRQYEEQGETV